MRRKDPRRLPPTERARRLRPALDALAGAMTAAILDLASAAERANRRVTDGDIDVACALLRKHLRGAIATANLYAPGPPDPDDDEWGVAAVLRFSRIPIGRLLGVA